MSYSKINCRYGGCPKHCKYTFREQGTHRIFLRFTRILWLNVIDSLAIFWAFAVELKGKTLETDHHPAHFCFRLFWVVELRKLLVCRVRNIPRMLQIPYGQACHGFISSRVPVAHPVCSEVLGVRCPHHFFAQLFKLSTCDQSWSYSRASLPSARVPFTSKLRLLGSHLKPRT